MYFNINFNEFFKLIKAHLLLTELYVYQNARSIYKNSLFHIYVSYKYYNYDSGNNGYNNNNNHHHHKNNNNVSCVVLPVLGTSVNFEYLSIWWV